MPEQRDEKDQRGERPVAWQAGKDPTCPVCGGMRTFRWDGIMACVSCVGDAKIEHVSVEPDQ